jgi:hypothetical protein
VLVEQRGQAIGRLPRAIGRALARLGQVGVGRGREQAFGQQRRIDAAIQRNVTQRQRAQGFAVVAVLERDEARAPGSPRFWKYWKAIFSATSTPADPLSA